MFLPAVLHYRLDLVALVGLTLLAAAGCWHLVRRRRPDEPFSPAITLLLLLLLVSGGLGAEWAGNLRRNSIKTLLSGLGATFAYELQAQRHAQITRATAADDPAYLRLIEQQKNWLRVNPQIADIYTFRADDEGRIRLIVDSETDYDHDGAIRGEREARTLIGEVYAEASPEFHRALRGEPCMDMSVTPDRWGVWVTSLTPIYDTTGHVEAALGIDYPAAEWLLRLLSIRGVVLCVAGLMIAVVLTSVTVGALLRAEIRERQAAQEKLRKDKDAADLVSRAKSEFISMMSHEIRSPLTALTGYASLLLETPLTPAQGRYVQTLSAMAGRLNAVVGDVYDLIKLQEGQLTVEAAPFSPASVVNDVVDALTARAIEKGLVLQLQTDLPPGLSLLGDAVRLRQVMASLLANAIKFTDHGSVVLTARWTPAPGELTLSIQDTGIGIAPERLRQLLGHSAEPTTAQGPRWGKGLGLVVCRQLVRLMHGRLDAQSKPGHGSTFTLTLPCSPDPACVPGTAATKPPQVASRHVLVVDHSAIDSSVLQSVLQRNGYAVTIVHGADETPQAFAQGPVVAVLIDVGNAEPDRLAGIRQIRAGGGAGEHVPLIAFADRNDRETRAACLALGVDECLAKPPYMPAVTAALESLLHTSAVPPA